MGKIPYLLCLISLVWVLTACGRTETSPPATPTDVVRVQVTRASDSASTDDVTAEPQVDTTDLSADDELAASVARGQALFTTLVPEAGFSCSQCHNVDNETRLIGPGLLGIGERAAARVEGTSAEDYLHESIVSPNAYIVEGDPVYPENLMPQVYGDVFSEDQITDIINYLFSL